MPTSMTTSTRCRTGLRSRRCPALSWTLALALPLALACGGTESFKPEPIGNPENLFWGLKLNTYGVRLSAAAPHDTFTVVATPVNYKGEPLTGLPAPQFTSSDPAVLLVNEQGRLRARALGQQFVIARLTADGVTHTDTVTVQIVDDAAQHPIVSYSIDPIAPDSAKTFSFGTLGLGDVNFGTGFGVGYTHLYGAATSRKLPVQAFDTAGGVITDLPLVVSSSDSTIAAAIPEIIFDLATFSFKTVPAMRGIRPGVVNIYAGPVTVFGVTKADTVQFRVGWPLYESVFVHAGIGGGDFNAPDVKIGPGGIVLWSSGGAAVMGAAGGGSGPTTETSIVFDDPTNVASFNPNPVADIFAGPYGAHGGFGGSTGFCDQSDCDASGNIMLPAASVAVRRFPVPGTYVYRNPANGATGRVVVMDE
jgi:hypothetical protein